AQAGRRDRARHLPDQVRTGVGGRHPVLEPVSVALKYGFLVVLYLFLMWVAWSALRDLRRGRGGVVESDRPPAQDATGLYDAAGLRDAFDDFEPRLLVEHAVGHESGVAYVLPEGATLGRGDVETPLDDPAV